MDWKKKRLNIGELPPRVSSHQIVKGKTVDPDNKRRRCLYCEYYTKSLETKKCDECLETKHLDNFEIDHFLKEDEKWQWLKE